MSKWTRDYATGVSICAVCGMDKGDRTECCKTAPYVDFDTFVSACFPGAIMGPMPDPKSPEYDRWLPRSTAKEFYSDYLTSNYKSLKAYCESR